jgi:hypothetical protein
MTCLSLAFWEQVFIDVVILIAIIALLRLFIVAVGGGSMWPPLVSPWSISTGSGERQFLGFLAAALNIIIWAIVMIAIIYFIFALLSCLLGAAGGFRLPLR